MALGKVKPLSGPLLLEPTKQENEMPSGLIDPDMAKEKPQEGAIISVRPGKPKTHSRSVSLDVGAGDTLLFVKFPGTELRANGQKSLILRQSGVLAILEG